MMEKTSSKRRTGDLHYIRYNNNGNMLSRMDRDEMQRQHQQQILQKYYLESLRKYNASQSRLDATLPRRTIIRATPLQPTKYYRPVQYQRPVTLRGKSNNNSTEESDPSSVLSAAEALLSLTPASTATPAEAHATSSPREEPRTNTRDVRAPSNIAPKRSQSAFVPIAYTTQGETAAMQQRLHAALLAQEINNHRNRIAGYVPVFQHQVVNRNVQMMDVQSPPYQHQLMYPAVGVSAGMVSSSSSTLSTPSIETMEEEEEEVYDDDSSDGSMEDEDEHWTSSPVTSAIAKDELTGPERAPTTQPQKISSSPGAGGTTTASPVKRAKKVPKKSLAVPKPISKKAKVPLPVLSSSTSEQTFYTGSVSLHLPEDEESLSPLHCFMRKYCVEAFTATAEDVATPRYGRSHGRSIVAGQVGIQCIHCKHRRFAFRQERAVCFPSTLKNIYHSIETWQRRHSLVCLDIPSWAKKNMTDLVGKSRSGAGGRRQYWEESAAKLGMVDTDHGIRFAVPPGEKAVAAAPAVIMSDDNDEATEDHKEAKCGVSNHALYCKPVVDDQDKELVTDYLYMLLDQMEVCYFSEQDRTGGRSKVKDCPLGYPGLQCKHCAGKAGFGRYFPVSLPALTSANSDRNIFNHISKCRRCPEEIRDNLHKTLQQQKQPSSSQGKNRRGWRKLFFRRVWIRMHGNSNTLNDSVISSRGETTSDPEAEAIGREQGVVAEHRDNDAYIVLD